MSENFGNRKEALMTAMWLEKTALRPEIADRCRTGIRSLSAGMSKAQVDECRRETEQRIAMKTESPVFAFMDSIGGTMRMDLNAARSVVLQGACGSPEEYDLVRGLAAFCLLSVVCDRLASQAGQMYGDALRTKAAADFPRTPVGRQHAARFEAASTLDGRTRRRALARLQRDMDKDYEVAVQRLDKAVNLEFATRAAACLDLPVGSRRYGSAHLN